MLGGMYGGYLRLLTPPGSRIVSVKDASGEVGVEEVERENGLSVFGRFFALPRDTKQRLQFTYITPAVAQQDGDGWRYSLALRRQPGWEQSRVTVHVTPPGRQPRPRRADRWRGGRLARRPDQRRSQPRPGTDAPLLTAGVADATMRR